MSVYLVIMNCSSPAVQVVNILGNDGADKPRLLQLSQHDMPGVGLSV